MKTSVDCLPCYLRQALQVARICSTDIERQHAVLAAVAQLLPDLDLAETPPANAIRIYTAIAEITGCSDPYLEVKKMSNEQALQILPVLREEVRQAEHPLRAALRFATAGNIIDYGAAESFDIEAAFASCRNAIPIIDHTDRFIEEVGKLQKHAKVLYLADNCGEIVYDLLVLECLANYDLDLTVAVKSGPIINDALLEDAMRCGIGEVAAIIANGTACPGTPLPECSTEFLRNFREADLVISKGQGNFETLSEVDRQICFFLTVKCPVVGRHIAEITGTDIAYLPGRGETVVYFSGNHSKYIGDPCI